jgi:hypothetical protein
MTALNEELLQNAYETVFFLKNDRWEQGKFHSYQSDKEFCNIIIKGKLRPMLSSHIIQRKILERVWRAVLYNEREFWQKYLQQFSLSEYELLKNSVAEYFQREKTSFIMKLRTQFQYKRCKVCGKIFAKAEDFEQTDYIGCMEGIDKTLGLFNCSCGDTLALAI